MVNKFWLITIVVVVLDQILKWVIRSFVKISIPVVSFFSIANIQNTGAGFGVLPGQRIFLVIVSLLVITFIIWKERGIFWSLILGGAIGNVIDRILFGSVTDFLAFSFWPAFNIADMAVVFGVIGLLVYYWKE